MRRLRSGTIVVKVKRIVADVAVSGFAEARRFYQDVLGLETVMAMEWIATYGSSWWVGALAGFIGEKAGAEHRHG